MEKATAGECTTSMEARITELNTANLRIGTLEQEKGELNRVMMEAINQLALEQTFNEELATANHYYEGVMDSMSSVQIRLEARVDELESAAVAGQPSTSAAQVGRLFKVTGMVCSQTGHKCHGLHTVEPHGFILRRCACCFTCT